MLGAITLGITGCLGALAGGALADRWGIRPVVIASRIGLMIVLFPVMKFLVANPSATTLVLAITILSLLHAAGVAVVVALIAVDLSARNPLDRARADLRARRCDLWRHGDLCHYVAGRRHRGSAGFDLLRDGGECGVCSWPLSPFEIPTPQPPPSRRRWIAKSRDERRPRAASPPFSDGVRRPKKPIQPILTGRRSSRQFGSKDLGGPRPQD